MVRVLRWGLVVCSLMALSGCVNRVGSFTFASTKNIDIRNTPYRIDAHQRVLGKDVVHIVVFFPTKSTPDLTEAMDNAIESAPGAIGLSDVTVKRGGWYIPLIYGIDYYEVEGNPVMPLR